MRRALPPSGARATASPSIDTTTCPIRSPSLTGPSTSSGARTLVLSCWPRRTVTRRSLVGASGTFSSRSVIPTRATASLDFTGVRR